MRRFGQRELANKKDLDRRTWRGDGKSYGAEKTRGETLEGGARGYGKHVHIGKEGARCHREGMERGDGILEKDSLLQTVSFCFSRAPKPWERGILGKCSSLGEKEKGTEGDEKGLLLSLRRRTLSPFSVALALLFASPVTFLYSSPLLDFSVPISIFLKVASMGSTFHGSSPFLIVLPHLLPLSSLCSSYLLPQSPPAGSPLSILTRQPLAFYHLGAHFVHPLPAFPPPSPSLIRTRFFPSPRPVSLLPSSQALTSPFCFPPCATLFGAAFWSLLFLVSSELPRLSSLVVSSLAL